MRGEGSLALIENLVFIMIITLIMSLVGPRVLNYLSDSKVKVVKIQIQIQSFGNALDLFNRYRPLSEHRRRMGRASAVPRNRIVVEPALFGGWRRAERPVGTFLRLSFAPGSTISMISCHTSALSITSIVVLLYFNSFGQTRESEKGNVDRLCCSLRLRNRFQRKHDLTGLPQSKCS